MNRVSVIAMILVVGCAGPLYVESLQAEPGNGGAGRYSTQDFARDYMIDALSRALEEPDITLAIVEVTKSNEAPPLEDGRSLWDVVELEEYDQISHSLVSDSLFDDIKLRRVLGGGKNGLAKRLFVPAVKQPSGLHRLPKPPDLRFRIASRWLLFLVSPFEEKTERQKAVMEKFRELEAGTFLNRRNFFLHWVPPDMGYEKLIVPKFDPARKRLVHKNYEAFICIHWPKKDEVPEKSRRMIEKIGIGFEPPASVPLATEQLPDDIETILEVIEDKDRSLMDHGKELLEKVTDPYAQEALKRLLHRKEARNMAEEYLVEALADFLQHWDEALAISGRPGSIAHDIGVIINTMEDEEDWAREGGFKRNLLSLYGEEVIQRMRMLELTGNLKSKAQIIEALGKALKGGRVVIPDRIEEFSDKAKMILENIQNRDRSLRAYEEELRAKGEKDRRARYMLKNLFDRREKAIGWVIDGFMAAIEHGVEVEIPISKSFHDDIKLIVETSFNEKPPLEDNAEELRDVIADPYVLEALERVLRRKNNTEDNAGDTEKARTEDCDSCP